jgi:hypothetical protein
LLPQICYAQQQPAGLAVGFFFAGLLLKLLSGCGLCHKLLAQQKIVCKFFF